MSYGAVVHASKQERRDVQAFRQRLHRGEVERRRRAAALLADRLPDLAGDNFAVFSLLSLWTQRGEGSVTPAMVRRERRRLIERNGWEVAA